MTDAPAELLTATEAADRLRISLRALQRLHQRRALPYVMVGGRARFPAAALAAWIAARIVYPEAGEAHPEEEQACTVKKAARIGGSPTATPPGARLSAVLKLPTAPKRP